MKQGLVGSKKELCKKLTKKTKVYKVTSLSILWSFEYLLNVHEHPRVVRLVFSPTSQGEWSEEELDA